VKKFRSGGLAGEIGEGVGSAAVLTLGVQWDPMVHKSGDDGGAAFAIDGPVEGGFAARVYFIGIRTGGQQEVETFAVFAIKDMFHSVGVGQCRAMAQEELHAGEIRVFC